MKWAGASDEFISSDQLPPIPKGLFGTWLPKPQRVYISIGKPVATRAYKGKTISVAAQKKLRDISRERLQQCIADMLLLQTQDRESAGFLRRFLTFLSRAGNDRLIDPNTITANLNRIPKGKTTWNTPLFCTRPRVV
jgi:hypothetical protein